MIMEPTLSRSFSSLGVVDDATLFQIKHKKIVDKCHNGEITAIIKDEIRDIVFTASLDGIIYVYDKVRTDWEVAMLDIEGSSSLNNRNTHWIVFIWIICIQTRLT